MTTTAPVHVRATEATVLADGPTSLITLLADADVTGGALTANRATLHRGSPGAPPHLHTSAAESFFVLDGVLDVLVGEEITTLRRGDLLVVPAGTRHAFAPAAGESADVLVFFTPGIVRFDYYRLLERVYRGEADPAEIGASGERYDNRYVDSPVWRARG
ncbi:cupin domain [Micromonospora kangleipakensis]|uniref:Cupin domain n=1 Tax=Micromonospora kangleipakensis TaxID=1077942 RepID=A0A4Q8BGG6_9ACTN|nr:cupin domain-containing protein [Micromonospora kangleipakensis]RZU76541.1 cupin domain [Micromonospora kangleipakensis]